MPDTLSAPDASLTTLAGLARPRDFGRKQRNPVRLFGGIAVALVLHILLIYALVNGLATRVVKIVTQPIEAHIIEPVKPPPPPPPPPKITRIVRQPPRVRPPPPPFVPPPEVRVRAAPPPTITHQAAPAPSAPVREAPPPPVPAPAPAPPARPVSRKVGVVCPNSDAVRASMSYPQEAQDNDITGDVTIEFTVDADGSISNAHAVQHTDPVLERAAYNTVKRFHCIGQGQAVHVQVPFSFNLN